MNENLSISSLIKLGQDEIGVLTLDKKEAKIESEVLLSFAINKSRVYLHSRPEKEVSIQEKEVFLNYINRRKRHEPVAYITGVKEFYGMDFTVKKGVLIPRPETEELIDIVLPHIKDNQSILDIGSGSGCISIVLKKLNNSLNIDAIDINKDAILCGRENSEKHLGSRDAISFIKANCFTYNFNKKYDIIISNPPYIPSSVLPTLSRDILEYEGYLPLDGGEDGLKFIKYYADIFNKLAKPTATFFLETNGEQFENILEIFSQKEYIESIEGLYDLSGKKRFIRGEIRCR